MLGLAANFEIMKVQYKLALGIAEDKPDLKLIGALKDTIEQLYVNACVCPAMLWNIAQKKAASGEPIPTYDPETPEQPEPLLLGPFFTEDQKRQLQEWDIQLRKLLPIVRNKVSVDEEEIETAEEIFNFYDSFDICETGFVFLCGRREPELSIGAKVEKRPGGVIFMKAPDPLFFFDTQGQGISLRHFPTQRDKITPVS